MMHAMILEDTPPILTNFGEGYSFAPILALSLSPTSSFTSQACFAKKSKTILLSALASAELA